MQVKGLLARKNNKRIGIIMKDKHFDVVVVSTGFSRLLCGAYLKETGVSDVWIFEMTHRLVESGVTAVSALVRVPPVMYQRTTTFRF
ncbi:MAG: ribulose 1,5-bisphosphate synthetase/thiazole synthase [Patiriisocius sp.]